MGMLHTEQNAVYCLFKCLGLGQWGPRLKVLIAPMDTYMHSIHTDTPVHTNENKC